MLAVVDFLPGDAFLFCPGLPTVTGDDFSISPSGSVTPRDSGVDAFFVFCPLVVVDGSCSCLPFLLAGVEGLFSFLADPLALFFPVEP